MSLTIEELRELLITLDQTSIAELTLKGEDFELTVRRDNGQRSPATTPALIPSSEAAEPDLTAPPSSSEVTIASPPVAPTLPPSSEKKWVEITSPMVGTFYRAPAPGESSFVEIGDRIQSGQTVCIIEAMKLMNEIDAEVSGEIVEILVDNAQPVEYGQPLMRVNPV